MLAQNLKERSMVTTGTITFEWAREFDESDYVWAKGYLSKKGVHDEYALGRLPILINCAENREVEAKLRGAWRQRKARKELIGRKAYSYILSDSSKRRLDKIARKEGSSITRALEKIIDSESVRDNEQAEKNKLLRQIRMLENKLAESNLDRRNDMGHLKVVSAALDQLAMRLALAKAKLDAGPVAETNNANLQASAISNYSTLQMTVRKDMGLVAHALRPAEAEKLWTQINNSIWPGPHRYYLDSPDHSDIL